MKFEIKGAVDMKLQGGVAVKLNGILYVLQAVKNILIVLDLVAKGVTMGYTKYKITIKKMA